MWLLTTCNQYFFSQSHFLNVLKWSLVLNSLVKILGSGSGSLKQMETTGNNNQVHYNWYHGTGMSPHGLHHWKKNHLPSLSCSVKQSCTSYNISLQFKCHSEKHIDLPEVLQTTEVSHQFSSARRAQSLVFTLYPQTQNSLHMQLHGSFK